MCVGVGATEDPRAHGGGEALSGAETWSTPAAFSRTTVAFVAARAPSAALREGESLAAESRSLLPQRSNSRSGCAGTLIYKLAHSRMRLALSDSAPMQTLGLHAGVLCDITKRF